MSLTVIHKGLRKRYKKGRTSLAIRASDHDYFPFNLIIQTNLQS